MAAEALGGVCFLRRNGLQYALRGSLAVTPGGTAKTGVAGMDAVHGFTGKIIIPEIDFEFSDLGGLSLVDLQAVSSDVITAELMNGKSYVLANAWFEGTAKVNAAEGTVSGKFQGLTCEEILAS